MSRAIYFREKYFLEFFNVLFEIIIFLKLHPANIKSSPELVFRRRKCDGGGYTVPQ